MTPSRKKLFRNLAVLVLLAAAGVYFRAFLLELPTYRYVYYDEAVTGLMAMDILKGAVPVFYWGCPYLGPLEALSGALFFSILGISTHSLRIATSVFFVVYAVFLFLLCRKATGKKIPLYAVFYLALPPLALSEYTFSPIGAYLNTVAIGTALLYITVRILEKPGSSGTFGAYLLLGCLSGFGFWTFMMIAPYVLACYLALFFKERIRFFGFRLLASAAGFFACSSPFWIWNLRHDFLTFALKAKSAAPTWQTLQIHLANYCRVLLGIMGCTEEFANSPFRLPVAALAAVLVLVLLAAFLRRGLVPFLYAAFSRKRSPGLMDLLVLHTLASSAAYILSAYGGRPLTRYLLPLYSSLPVFLTVFLTRMSSRKPALHFAFVPLLVLLHLPHHAAYIRKNRFIEHPDEIVSLIEKLKRLDIRHAYAHYTIGQPITFESRKRIICSDLTGFRNVEYLKQVDASDRVAWITHRKLRYPAPEIFENQLKLLTRDYRKFETGDYVVFHDFRIKPRRYREINERILSIQAHPFPRRTRFMTDRNISTAWISETRERGSEEIVIALDRETRLSRVVLSPGLNGVHYPEVLSLEISEDGENWTKLHHAASSHFSLVPFGNHPRFRADGTLDIRFDPVTARLIRLRQTGNQRAVPWKIAELLLFEPIAPCSPVPSETLSRVLAELDGRVLVTAPRLLARIERLAESPLDAVPLLYDPMLVFRDDCTLWDVDHRLLDLSKPAVFLVYPEREREIVRLLEAKKIPFTRWQLDAFSWIAARPVAAPSVPAWHRKLFHWEQTPDAIRFTIPENVPVREFSMRLSDPNFDITRYTLSVSDDGKKWTTPEYRENTRLYWSDLFLARLNPPRIAWRFSETFTPKFLKIRFPEDAAFPWNATGGYRLVSRRGPLESPHSLLPPFHRENRKKAAKAYRKSLKYSTIYDPARYRALLLETVRNCQTHIAALRKLEELENWENRERGAKEIRARIDSIYSPTADVEADFDAKIRLSGIRTRVTRIAPGTGFKMTFYLEPLETFENDFQVFLHFTDPSGNVVFQDDHTPVNETTPPLIPGELLVDERWIRVPGDIDYRGELRLLCGIWQPEKNRRFRVESTLPHAHRAVEIMKLRIE